MDPGQARKRFEAAYKLVNRETILIEQFKALKDLIAGLNPKVDRALDSCSKALATVEKLQRGKIVELSAENLPEKTEEEKKPCFFFSNIGNSSSQK